MGALPGLEIGWYANTAVKQGHASAIPVGLGIALARLLALVAMILLQPETFRFLDALPSFGSAYFVIAGVLMMVVSRWSFNDTESPFIRRVGLGSVLTLINPVTIMSMYIITSSPHGHRYEVEEPMLLLMHALIGILLALSLHSALATLARRFLAPATAARVFWIGLGLLSIAIGVAMYGPP